MSVRVATIQTNMDERCDQCGASILPGDVYIDCDTESFCTNACADEWNKDKEEARYDAEQAHPRHGGAWDNLEARIGWMRLK